MAIVRLCCEGEEMLESAIKHLGQSSGSKGF